MFQVVIVETEIKGASDNASHSADVLRRGEGSSSGSAGVSL